MVLPFHQPPLEKPSALVHVKSTTSSKKTSRTNEPQSLYSLWSAFIDDFLRLQSDTWAFEILSLLVSMIALISAGIVLKHFDGKPYPNWPYSLTLNAFVSVCMTVMVAALTVPVSSGLGQLKWMLARRGGISVMHLDNLDRASRGLWGSIYSLFSVTGGFLGVLGSVVTIFALAAAPFGQQAISSSIGQIETRQDPNSTITSCAGNDALVDFCPYKSLKGDFKKGRNQLSSFLKRGYYSSIYSTFNKSALIEDLSSCPTGNCTWNTISTLSICSKCTNITDLLKIDPTNGQSNAAQLASIPNGPSLDSSFSNFALGLTIPSASLPTNNATIYTFAALQAGETGLVDAVECRLNFCVQRIKSKVEGGLFTEEVEEEFTEVTRHDNVVLNRTTSEGTSLISFNPPADRRSIFGEGISIDLFTSRCLTDILDFDNREKVPLSEMGLERIPTVASDMAVSVARALRTICRQKKAVLGSSFQSTTLVRIDWWWFVLPVAVEALGAAFFLILCDYNRRSKTSLWKSSLIAALFHNVELRSPWDITATEGLHDMEQLAERTNVRLMSPSSQGDGWTKLLEENK